MGTEPRHFFVIGYPRSRTAWLSVLLHGDGVVCQHEASGGRGAQGIQDAFEDWNAPVMGTCDSGLIFSTEALLELYPDAYWVIVLRDSQDALSSMMADRPYEATSWKERWNEIEEAMSEARQLTMLSKRTLVVNYNEIDENISGIYWHCTGRQLDCHKHCSLKGLKITQIPSRPRPIPESVTLSAVERLTERGFSPAGLFVRPFEAARDLLLFSQWGKRRGIEGANLAPYLPPLGVVVEDASGPAAMLFCRECYCVPAADLEFSVSRPGLSLKAAGAAMAFAVSACIDLAGKLVVPEAHYNLFRVTCRPSLGRFVQRLGFVPHGDADCQKFIYQK